MITATEQTVVLRRKALASGTAIIALLCACSTRMSIDEHRVRTTVREYNRRLTTAFSTKNPELLAPAATQDEVDRVFTIVLGLSQRNLVLDSRQESMRVESVRFPRAGRAELITEETWWYRHQRPDGDEDAQKPRRLRYRVRYQLVSVGDDWKVNRLENIATEALPLEAPRS